MDIFNFSVNKSGGNYQTTLFIKQDNYQKINFPYKFFQFMNLNFVKSIYHSITVMSVFFFGHRY